MVLFYKMNIHVLHVYIHIFQELINFLKFCIVLLIVHSENLIFWIFIIEWIYIFILNLKNLQHLTEILGKWLNYNLLLYYFVVNLTVNILRFFINIIVLFWLLLLVRNAFPILEIIFAILVGLLVVISHRIWFQFIKSNILLIISIHIVTILIHVFFFNLGIFIVVVYVLQQLFVFFYFVLCLNIKLRDFELISILVQL